MDRMLKVSDIRGLKDGEIICIRFIDYKTRKSQLKTCDGCVYQQGGKAWMYEGFKFKQVVDDFRFDVLLDGKIYLPDREDIWFPLDGESTTTNLYAWGNEIEDYPDECFLGKGKFGYIINRENFLEI